MTVLKFSSSVIILYLKLFRFATKFEKLAIIIGVVLSIISAFGVPFGVIIYGEFTALLVDRHVRKRNSTQVLILEYFGGGDRLYNGTLEENRDALVNDSKAFLFSNIVIGLYVLILGTISIDIINHIAVKQIGRIRKLIFESILRQEIGWFDTNEEHNFAVCVTDNLEKWKDGIGEKLSIFIYLVTMFIVSVILSFSYGWKLTLVILCCAPIIILSTSIVSRVQTRLSKNEVTSYSKAGSAAEEVLRAIRSVIVFGGEEKELKRYRDKLKLAEDAGIKKGLYSGFGSGLMWFISYGCYALAFWYGIKLILEDRDNFEKEYTPAVLIIVLFGIVTGAQNLGFTTPHLEAFYSAYSAAAAIFNVVDRKSRIDSLSDEGLKPKLVSGGITFKNVSFSYPSRKSINVLNSLTLNIKVGEKLALVGLSGCGKSTILQLIERFYDPTSGSIYLDGSDIRTINVNKLRSTMGHVSQEPVLFSTSIEENIRYGKLDATDDEIKMAARIAHCHEFIKRLPEGYKTLVGERGNQLSGGQKQRIAIARAIVKNPKILLLDEATSALDQNSELDVQKALDNAAKGRTTIIVSHRLSTVVNADRLAFIDNGEIKEIGTHIELMRLKGLYYQMVQANNQIIPKSPRNVEITTNQGQQFCIDLVPSELETKVEEPSEQREIHKITQPSWKRVISFNSPEWLHLSIGCVASIICGIHLPIYAIIFAEIFGIFALDDPSEISDYSLIYSSYIFVIGVIVGIATFAQIYLFTYSGVKLTSRLRIETFKSMMRQEIGWFDETKNSVGALCVRLASDASNVQGATGTRLGTMFQCSSMLGLGLIIALYYSWSLTLVSLISSVLVVLAVYIENKYIERSSLNEKVAMEKATRIAIESISNIRTVASLCHEREVLNQYIKECEDIEKAGHQKSRLRGVVFSFGQAAPCIAFGLALWYGGILVARYDLPYITMIKVSEALIFGSWMLGQSLAHTPNFTGAKLSAGRLIEIIDRKPKIIKHSRSISSNERFDGNVKFDSIKFNYPTRPNIQVLNDFNLNIKSGQSIALVGSSGCGKSTCIQLLLRYYDPLRGSINVDYVPTVEYSLETLRRNFGIVSQEPILLDRTIAENIAYGDNTREITETEIIEVAKIANIHKFVTKFPLGYETEIGKLGGQLSGGQKQRIAIARAIIRNPSILLLDEATSALDSQNEKIVQATLDKVKNGRTCITIAHRLSTIQNADLICVIENGQIAESGTHNELLLLGQLYSQLYKLQCVE